jgi:hypothetical protein
MNLPNILTIPSEYGCEHTEQHDGSWRG